jgi:hypothetical protein
MSRRPENLEINGAPQTTSLQSAFLAPSHSARPCVWWHWMNGNVTQEGVRLDFEWMKRTGIAGVQNFDASFPFGAGFDIPQVVEKPLDYLTSDWQRMLRYSVQLASELGLEFTIASSAGWSESGGPWVQPHQAMKKLVWSETLVRGGATFAGRLPKAPATTGPFQNLPLASFDECDVEQSTTPLYYADVAVVAYRLPASEIRLSSLAPRVTTSAGTFNAEVLYDGDLAKVVSLPFEGERDTWIQFSFSQPQCMQAITSLIGHPIGTYPPLDTELSAWLEVSDDGLTFRKIADIPRNDALPQTISFAPVVARLFRVVIRRPEETYVQQLGLASLPVAHQIAELVLHAGPRVNRFEDKAGYSTLQIRNEDAKPTVATRDMICWNEVVNLTSRMKPDGSLVWTPPAGQWAVLRFGYSLTGRTNHPASDVGTGLEVDKLNSDYVKAYIETYLDNYEKALGPALMGRKGLQYMLTDSYEAGAQNWTDDMPIEFERRRRYSLIPWLPVLAGRVVNSAEDSDRFLWDFRKTLGELIAEAHYGQITDCLYRRGLGRYGESHETHRAFIGDGMEVKKTADIPMGAIWAGLPRGYTQEGIDADIRESASVAHIYGQNIAAAESFTAYGNAYGFTPEILKPLADRAMAMGLNKFVIHTSVHQPDGRIGPGIGLGPFGQWFTRKEVWSEMAGSWINYLASSSYLLQQGRFVADIAYLYGEDTNVTSLFGTSAPPIPQGYDFDFVNPDALLNEFSVQNGRLKTRSGMEYCVLALDAISMRRVSVPLLRKIRDLVRSGAVLVGAKPIQTPSLTDDELEFATILTELWGAAPNERTVGEGKVFAGHMFDEALRLLHIPPDIEFLTGVEPELRFLHRSLGNDGDLYFISNGNSHPITTAASFRVIGRKPELWRADTAIITPITYHVASGRTIVPLRLEAHDAVFIVFQQPTAEQSAVVPESTIELLTTVIGPWNVSFPPDLGAPSHARFDRLRSWTENVDDGIKYFSGTATYSKTIRIHREWLSDNARIQIDLGEVKHLAEVLLNGRSLGVLWRPQFTTDITEAAHPGDNHLEVKVANIWPNRLIGDKQPTTRKIAFASYDPFKADSPLVPSGLLGPVTLTKSHHK